MKIMNVQNYQSLSERVADEMIQALIQQPDINICVATGGSTELAYQIFVKKVKEQHIDVSLMTITKLDEWLGLDEQSKSSCEYFIRHYLLEPLNIEEKQYLSFDLMAEDPQEECQRIVEALESNPIDLCLLGLGKNGHLALNEPANDLHAHAHVAKLSEQSKQHRMLNGTVLEQGMTLGMKDIFDSKNILFIISGQGKDEIVKELMTQKITSQLPASLLWLHHHTTCIVDEELYGYIVK